MVDTVYVNKNGGVRKRRLACPSSGTFLPQHAWDPRHAQNGRRCARRCLGRKRLCLIHYVCLRVSFVSAEPLNIISIGPTRFVSNVKTAPCDILPCSITAGGIKTAGLETELLSNAHCHVMHVASVVLWTILARLRNFRENLCLWHPPRGSSFQG